MTKMSKTIKTLLAGLAASLFVAAPASANDFSVMNGEEIMLYSFPWYVSLNATGYDTNSSFYCGGSLIHSNWVMTAAHCVVDNRKKPYRISAVVGHHWLSTSNPDQIAVKRVVVHPNYNPYNNDSDIALLELTAPVPNAVTIRPGWPALPIQNGTQAIAVGHGTTVPLINYLVDRFNLSIGCQINLHTCVREMFDQGQTPVQVLDNLLLANGMGDPKKGVGYINLVYRLLQLGYSPANNGMSTAEIVGGFALMNIPYDEIADIVFAATQPYGTDELRQVMLPLLNDINECAKQTGMEITPNMLCAGYGKKLPKDTCQGDSGGPLMTYDRFGNRVQVGIVSSGPVCGDSYGTYTRVANFLDWIGGIVPFSNAERVFNYVENITTMLYLPIGHEQSQYYMPYWGRYYPASNIGLGTDNITLYNYDVPTATRFPIGDFAAWFVAASHAGY